jgi:hypothetical protein
LYADVVVLGGDRVSGELFCEVLIAVYAQVVARAREAWSAQRCCIVFRAAGVLCDVERDVSLRVCRRVVYGRCSVLERYERAVQARAAVRVRYVHADRVRFLRRRGHAHLFAERRLHAVLVRDGCRVRYLVSRVRDDAVLQARLQ